MLTLDPICLTHPVHTGNAWCALQSNSRTSKTCTTTITMALCAPQQQHCRAVMRQRNVLHRRQPAGRTVVEIETGLRQEVSDLRGRTLHADAKHATRGKLLLPFLGSLAARQRGKVDDPLGCFLVLECSMSCYESIRFRGCRCFWVAGRTSAATCGGRRRSTGRSCPVELPKTRHAPEYFSTYKGALFTRPVSHARAALVLRVDLSQHRRYCSCIAASCDPACNSLDACRSLVHASKAHHRQILS